MVIKVTKDTFIEFNENTKQATVLDRPTLVADLANAKSRLKEIKPPSDKELLEWARANYPYESDVEQTYVREVIERNQAILDEIKAL